MTERESEMTERKEQFSQVLTFTGQISSRAKSRTSNIEGQEPLDSRSFDLTTAPETRVNRDGQEYRVDPEYNFSVFNTENNENNQRMYNMVGDFQIGDKVTVEAALLTSKRRGYPHLSFRVLNITNLGNQE